MLFWITYGFSFLLYNLYYGPEFACWIHQQYYLGMFAMCVCVIALKFAAVLVELRSAHASIYLLYWL